MKRIVAYIVLFSAAPVFLLCYAAGGLKDVAAGIYLALAALGAELLAAAVWWAAGVICQ